MPLRIRPKRKPKVNNPFPKAADLVAQIEKAKAADYAAKVKAAQDKLIPMIQQHKNTRRFTALFSIPEEVQKQLQEQGYKVQNTGMDRGVEIASSFEITW